MIDRLSGDMTVAEIRLRLLELADPGVSNPDALIWIQRAQELEAYVMGAGQPSNEVPPKPMTLVTPKSPGKPLKGPALK